MFGDFWGVRMASRLDSNTSSITIFLRELCAIFLLPSISAYIGIIIGIVDGFSNGRHCCDVMSPLRMFLGIIFGTSTWIVVGSVLSIGGDFMKFSSIRVLGEFKTMADKDYENSR